MHGSAKFCPWTDDIEYNRIRSALTADHCFHSEKGVFGSVPRLPCQRGDVFEK